MTSLPLASHLKGHEFHYSTIDWQGAGEPLFDVDDATGTTTAAGGAAARHVMGSYAHVIA